MPVAHAPGPSRLRAWPMLRSMPRQLGKTCIGEQGAGFLDVVNILAKNGVVLEEDSPWK